MSEPTAAPKMDDVLFVLDIWDVPLSGVAMFEGKFHSFQRVYDEEAQSWANSNGFLLQSLTGAELAQFNELHDRAGAWLDAYKAGTAGPHPMTPEATGADAERYRALHRAVDAVLFAETERTVRCNGTMSYLPGEKRYVAEWHKS